MNPEPQSLPTGLRIQDLGVSKGGVPVLAGLELEAAPGERLAILGPTGCGKTTLLRAIAGLEIPDRGTIALEGRIQSGPGLHLPPAERGIAMAFQQPALWPHLTVEGNIAFAVAHLGRAEARARTAWALELLGLEALARRHPAQLSGGQARRAALARALAPRAPLLLLDEPLVNLDPASREACAQALRIAHQAAPCTLLLVTHDRAEAEALCSRVWEFPEAAN